ncbi:MAG: DUF1062 domain-containing protein [Proteobacteria bacterium]|nr:DUF1062 domain-containing protein [Pseudomonadota bacterium]MBI3497398.1 DUF1062 domain-containing protein [Pseudomonadota bacterium]
MVAVLRVRWTVVPQLAPQPLLTCSRCGEIKSFRCSRMIRVNANGKRLDAWLIYKCTTCDSTWNWPILERRRVGTVDPAFLVALQTNDPQLVRQLAFDVTALRRTQHRVQEFAEVKVRKEVLEGEVLPRSQLEIQIAAHEPVALRLDRLLATELGNQSRARIHSLREKGTLVVSPDGPRVLSRPARDWMCITMHLSKESDGDKIARAAAGLLL